jgi:hypothetical protein
VSNSVQTMKHFAILGIALVIVIVFHTMSFACSCGRISIEDAFLQSDAVFLGQVLDVQKNVGSIRRWFYGLQLRFIGGTFDDSVFHMSVTFSVNKRWKGATARSFVVQTPDAKVCCICGYEFEVGKSYLVYASGTPLYTNICSRTKTSSEAVPDTALLDRLTTELARIEK